MRTSHVISVCVALAISIVLAGGCGSSRDTSLYGDDGGDGGSSSGSSGFVGFGDAGEAAPACVNLQCQQTSCSNGAVTSLSGTVYAPNGTLPLYNAIVYVPNAKPDAVTHGATCDQCGAVTGNPLVTALSQADGTFTLKNVPVGSNIPLVIQVGKWRRQVVIPEVAACTDNQISNPDLTRLPRTQAEGDIPHIALTTGGCDKLGCMLPKVGIDASEFGVEGSAASIHLYNGSGGQGPGVSLSAKPFWSDATKLKAYDMAILSCECSEAPDSKDATSFQAMTDYLTSGGRIFTTDYMYTWYKKSPDMGLNTAAVLPGGAPPGGSPLLIDTSFPKGKALGDWLQVVKPGSMDMITPDVVFANISSLDTMKSQQWASSPPFFGGSTQQPRVFTVNVPTNVPADKQCGRGVHLDAHLNQNTSDVINASFPAGCGKELTDGEKLLAFFFFDLASCIQSDTSTPAPPVVK